MRSQCILLTTPPSNFCLKAEVVAILPFIESKTLLLQRLPSHAQANLWCPPGGKRSPDEGIHTAAIREMEEETNLIVHENALTELGTYYIRYPNGDFLFHLFMVQLPKNAEVSISPTEHQAYCIIPVDEIGSLPLTPGLDEGYELALKKMNMK